MIQEALAFGDANESSVGVTKATIDRLLKLQDPSEAMALYLFFCYTARWQNTRTIKATVSYIASGLRWGERKVQLVKAKLREIGLIEDVSRRDGDGRVEGWFVEVRYIVLVQGATGCGVDQGAKLPGGGAFAPKCLETGKVNANGSVNGGVPSKDSKRHPTSPAAIRIAKLFHRRLTTAWAPKEITAFKRLAFKTDDDLRDLELVCEYTEAQREINGIHRRELQTFLNNYLGELDRARAWKINPESINVRNGHHRPTPSHSPANAGTANQTAAGEY